nr:reverse transcriptase domain-containing protein [Tanacetum cinerariifolium]
MSSPNHPTSDIKDAFSSNFPDYILASSDHSPASPRNTPSESPNNSYGLVPIASSTLSLFHDDPYMKVMHAYDAIIPPQVPIPSPAIVPPSLMLSPIFNPQELFVPKELLPRKEQGASRIWLEKEPPRLIFIWDDLVSKFINQFFPPSKTTNLRNEITNFQQRFDESFSEAWDRFKDLLRACPHHGLSELHQLDTFYNAINSKDQDSLNSATGGKFLDKMPRECLAIIESKSKVCYSRNKPVVAKVSTNTSTSGISPDVAELKDMVKALFLDKKSQSPAPVKAVEESCVTCGGAHSYHNCPATDGNVYRDNIQEFVSQASIVNYNQGNTSYRPPMMSNQIQPPGFPPVPNNQKVQRNNQNHFIPNQNRGNNFNQGPVYLPSVFQPLDYQAPAYQAPAPQTQGTLPSNTIANPRSDLKAITTQSGVSYDGPQISPSPSFHPKVVEDEPEATKDTVNPTNNGSTEDVQPQVVQSEAPILTFELVTSPISELQLLRLSLPDLTPTFMTLELADHSISRLVGVAEDVYVKVGSFHFSADFVVVYFDADPRVPLILERSFLKTGRALIDVFEGELTLRVSKEAITFNLDQTSRYSANYSDMTAKRIDVIDMACEEHSQKVLVDEPPTVELKDLPPHLEYAFLEGDNKLPLIIAKDLSIEEKTTLITAMQCSRHVSEVHDGNFHDMIEKTMEVFMDDFSIFGNLFQSCFSHLERMLKRHEDTNLCLNWEKSHFMVKEGIVLSHKIFKQRIKVDKAKGMPFELMCDASDFAIGAVLGQRQDKHFRPTHYASKTMTEAESNYTTTEKEMLAVVYAFVKFRSYLIINKSIVYTNHSTLKYLFVKKDSKARLFRWVLLLQEFTFKVIDTKGAENLAANHLS